MCPELVEGHQRAAVKCAPQHACVTRYVRVGVGHLSGPRSSLGVSVGTANRMLLQTFPDARGVFSSAPFDKLRAHNSRFRAHTNTSGMMAA